MERTHVSELEDFAPFTGEGMLKLDLACGASKKENFTGVDIFPCEGVDIVADLNKYPWSFAEENSVYELYCSHFIEHVADIKSFMEECWRILMPSGHITFIAPYYTSIRAFQDFTHVRPISEATFYYFNQDWLKANKLEHYGVRCNFAVEYTKYCFESQWVIRGDEAREWARKHIPNSVLDMETMLKAIK